MKKVECGDAHDWHIAIDYDIIGFQYMSRYVLVAVWSSGILEGKQKLGVTFNSDKLGSINFTKFSKLTMCSAYLGGSLDIDFSKNLVCPKLK